MLLDGSQQEDTPDLEAVRRRGRRFPLTKYLTLLRRRLPFTSLAFQFLALGGVVSLLAMLLVGVMVTTQIEKAVTRNAAATSALYVDSVIAPLLPDMRANAALEDVVRRALDETLSQGALRSRLVEMRLWALDGTILYAQNPELIGQRFPITDNLRQAFAGHIVGNYDRFDKLDEASDNPAGPILEIYNPLLQPWSGDVVGVIEFYERAHELEATLQNALRRSWLAVAAIVLLFFGSLSVLVFRGSRTIDRQAADLNTRVEELTALLDQNRALHLRVQRATQQATALNESYLRRLGADLHDGPAQFIALATMRLDSDLVLAPGADPRKRDDEISSIRTRLAEALDEIRAICRGLVLPQIESSDLNEVVSHAVDEYEKRTGAKVCREIADADTPVSLSQRICAYRFVQEALNNGYRHCRGATQRVGIDISSGTLSISVGDTGPGFDPASIPRESIGIAGIRERIESLGGTFLLDTSSRGTKLVMILELEEPAGR